jgi:hypothetical protein
MKTAQEEYPELNIIAQYIVDNAIKSINENTSLMAVKTKCPYPAQCLLEIVISKLEKCV